MCEHEDQECPGRRCRCDCMGCPGHGSRADDWPNYPDPVELPSYGE